MLFAKIELMDKRDYYEILGVDKNATLQEIKKSYRKLARKYHPDHNKEDGADAKFREVQEAYEVLSDDSKRNAYDQYGHAGTEGFFSGESGGFDTSDFGGAHFDMGDIFNQFFGGSGQGFGFDFGGSSRKEKRGVDLRYKVKLGFLESMEEQEIAISVRKDKSCKSCKGTGSSNGNLVDCKTCRGIGQVRKMRQSILGQISVVSECSDCQGRGKIPEDICNKCKGGGIVSGEEKVKVKIPAGAYDGMLLRFGGGGSYTQGVDEPGDLFIELVIEPHELFERRGDDIHSQIDISVPMAVLGGVESVKTVLGEVKLKIPAGTQSGTVFKIKRKGSPVIGHPSRRGDHYVKAKVKIPEKLGRQEKKIWEMLKK